MTFGEFLKVQREAKEWKQPEAAQKIAIEQSYLSKLENNKAVPSADIFDRLMSAYQFTMQQVSEAVQSTELEKLKEIVVVREFILSTKKRRDKDKRRFLITGVVMSMIGALLLSLGIVMHDYKEPYYQYESKGVIKSDENIHLFMNMPDYRQFTRMMSTNGESAERIKSDVLFSRLDYQIKTIDVDVGAFYDRSVEGGVRRYQKISSGSIRNKTMFYFGVSVGCMFLFGSFSMFFVSRRW